MKAFAIALMACLIVGIQKVTAENLTIPGNPDTPQKAVGVTNSEEVMQGKSCTSLCDHELALFDVLFQGEEIERKPEWNIEYRALFSSGLSASHIGHKNIYTEAIRILSIDGKELTILERVKKTNGRYVYKKEVKTATIFPFVFAYPLIDIVDKKDERIDFYCWQMDESNVILRNITVKLYNFRADAFRGEKEVKEFIFWQNKDDKSGEGASPSPDLID